MRKIRKSRRATDAPMVHIGSRFDSPDAKALIATIATALEQAIVMGRTEIGVELATRLGQMGGVSHVTISDSTFTGK